MAYALINHQISMTDTVSEVEYGQSEFSREGNYVKTGLWVLLCGSVIFGIPFMCVVIIYINGGTIDQFERNGDYGIGVSSALTLGIFLGAIYAIGFCYLCIGIRRIWTRSHPTSAEDVMPV